MAMPFKSKTISYVRNVGRSLGYASLDVLKDNTPYLNSLFKESKESVSDIYKSIKSFREGKTTDIKSQGKEALDSLFKNLKSDIRSGDYYNKSRDEVFDNEMMKMMGFDFEDNEFSFDDADFEFGDQNDDISDGEELIVKQNAKNTAATIMAVDKVGGKVVDGVNKGTAASANYIVSSTATMNKAMMALNSKGFATVTDAIATLNSNTIAMNEALIQPLTRFMQNGTLFFTKTTEALDKIVKNTEEMLKYYTSNSTRSSSSRKRSLNDVMSGGGLSVSAYKDMVGGNIKDMTALFSMITGFGGGNKGSLAGMAKGISPLRYPLKWMMNGFIPAILTTSLKNFDDALKTFLPSMVAKGMSSKGNGGFFSSILRSIFLPENKLSRNVNPAAYNQGPIPFDGQTKKAITEVIPTYLSQILSAVTGGEATRYDYRKGAFVRSSEITKMIADREREYAKRGGGKLMRDALAGTSDTKTSRELEDFFMQAFLTGEGFTDINKLGFKNSTLGKRMSSKTLMQLRKLVRSGKYNSMPANMMLARGDYSKLIEELSLSGTALDLHMLNGSDKLKTGKAIGGVDKYGNSTLDYLRGIYVNTLNGGSSTRRRGGRGSSLLGGRSVDMPSLYISTETNSVTGGISSPRKREDVNQDNQDQVDAWNKAIDSEIKKLADELNKFKAREKKGQNVANDISRIQAKIDSKTQEYIGENGEVRSNIIIGQSKVNNFFGDKRSSTSGIISEKLAKIMPKGMVDFLERPINAVSKLLDNITNSMTSFLWGDGSKDGIFDIARKKISKAIENNQTIQKFLDSFLGVKDEKGKRPGLQKVWTDTKRGLREYWTWMKSGFNETWDQTGSTGARYTHMNINPSAANGRKITKGGMIAVSEGEMVIPAELNPYYNKSINKREQYRQENRAMRNYQKLYGGRVLGGYRNGTTYINPEYAEDDIAGYKSDEVNEQLKKALNGPSRDATLEYLRRKYNPNGNTVKIFGKIYYRSNDGKWSTYQSGSFREGLGNAFRDARDIVGDNLHNFSNRYGGKTKENINKFLDNFGPDLKAARGRIGAGALIGTGLGGMAGFPLVGLVVGSVAGFVSKSERAQNMLFGEIDEKTGERKGGVFSKKMANFLEKVAPEMTRGGSIGALAGGLLVGGPLGLAGGMVVGTALGYARKSKAAQEFLFGKFDEEGNLIKKGLIDKEKLQKALPKGIIGAGLGLLVGPAGGVFTNMVLGAGLGFLTQNQKVHDFLFGNKDKNKMGLLPKIGDKLFGGIDDLLHNTANFLKVTISNLGKNILTKVGNIKDWFIKRRARKEALNRVNKTPLRKFFDSLGKVGKGVGIGTAGLLAAPFLAPFAVPLSLAAAGISAPRVLANSRMRMNARRGYNIYDRKLGRNMTAAERAEYRSKHMFADQFGPVGGNKITGARWDQFDEAMAGANLEELKSLEETLASADESSRTIKQIQNKSLTSFYTNADNNMSSAEMDEVASFIKNGETQKLINYLSRHQNITNVREIIDQAKQVEEAKNKRDEAKKTLKTRFNFKGGLKDLSKAQELVKNEIKAKTPQEIQAEDSIRDSKFQSQTSETLTTISNNIRSLVDNGITINTNGTPATEEVITDPVTGNKKRRKRKKSNNGVSQVFVRQPGDFSPWRPGEPKVMYVANGDSDKIKYRWDGKDWIKDMRDKETAQESKDSDQAEEAQIKSIGKLEQIRDAILGKFDRKKSKDDEDDEEKESIFDKLLDFAGSGIKDLLSGILSGITSILPILGTIAGGVVAYYGSAGIKGLYNLFTGKYERMGKLSDEDAIAMTHDDEKTVDDIQKAEEDKFKSYSDRSQWDQLANGVPDYLSSGDSVIKDIFDRPENLVWNAHKEEYYNDMEKLDALIGKYNETGELEANVYHVSWRGPTDYVSFYNRELRFMLPKRINKLWWHDDFWVRFIDIDYEQTHDFLRLYQTDPTVKLVIDYLKNVALTTNQVDHDDPRLEPGNLYALSMATIDNGGMCNYEAARDYIKNNGKYNIAITTHSGSFEDFVKANADIYGIDESEHADDINSGLTNKEKTNVSGIVSINNAAVAGAAKNLYDNSDYFTNKYSGEDYKEFLRIYGKDSLDTNADYSAYNQWLKDRNGKGSRLKLPKILSGKSSGFVSQFDSKYANRKYGTTNIADAGCGPAVASMAASAFGKKLSMDEAISAGQRYTTSQGTDADYFTDILGSRGISTSYLDGAGTVDSLAKGNPVVMLGQDRYNTSKSYSPFGPGGHYVLGRGFDNNGNVIIEDPEMGGITKYNPNILNSVKAAIGKGSGLYGKGSYERSDTKDKVYKWLVENGYSPATAAGIMGNIDAESSFKYDEHSYDGHYPSLGMFQWEKYRGNDSTAEGRARELIKYAINNGTNWKDIGIQLAFMNKEMNGLGNWLDPKNSTDEEIKKACRGNYRKKDGTWVDKNDTVFARSGFNFDTDGVSLGQFKSLSDPGLAARYFHASFERSADKWGSNQMNRRINAAQAYYNIYSNLSNLNANATNTNSSNYKSPFVSKGSNRTIKYTSKCNVKSRFDQGHTDPEGRQYYVTLEDPNERINGAPIKYSFWSKKSVSGTFYHIKIKDNYIGSTKDIWAKVAGPATENYEKIDFKPSMGDVKIQYVQLDSKDTKNGSSGEETYALKYTDGNWYKCVNKSGIANVEFIHTRGKYIITYADGSKEESDYQPGAEDYPQGVTLFNPTAGMEDTLFNDSSTAVQENNNGGLLSRILNAFSTGLNALFNGNDVEASLANLGATVYSSSSNNIGNTYTGSNINPLDYLNAGSAEIEAKKNEMVQDALKREKTEIYSQKHREQSVNGVKYSDCSSFASRMYKNAFGIDIGGDTDAQWRKAKKGSGPMTLIHHSQNNRPNASVLKPGDLIYWGNNSSHLDNVGHVEIYAGNNQLIGQDAGDGNYGPRLKNYSDYRQSRSINYIGTTRLIGKGSGLFGKGFNELSISTDNEIYRKALAGDPDAYKRLSSNQKKIVDMLRKAKSLNNKEQYSMHSYRGTSRNGYFYSDCSEFASRMYRDAGITSKLRDLNTTQQVQAIRSGEIPGMKMVVWDPKGEDRSKWMNQLKPGDLLYFKTRGYRNKGWGDPETHGNVSHVELYAGNNYIVGQDAIGPNLDPEEMTTDGTAKQGSGPTYRSLDSIRPAPDNYQEMFSNARYDDDGKRHTDQALYDRFIGATRWDGAGSGLVSNAYNNLIAQANSIGRTNDIAHKTNNIILTGKGSKSDGLLEQLVAAILEVLKSILNNNNIDSTNIAAIKANSDNLNTITELLSKYKEVKKKAKSSLNENGEIDESFRSVIDKMAALARG